MRNSSGLRFALFVAVAVTGAERPAAAGIAPFDLYNFGTNSSDVVEPQPFGEIVVGGGGNFYGTAPLGGTNGYGGFFKITHAGVETVPYSFTAGNNPTCQPGLMRNGAYFIGTCYGPGAGTGGALYKMTLAGGYSLRYAFAGAPLHGANPDGPPIAIGTTFYGTTAWGGANNLGTIYKFVLPSSVTMLYSFTGGADGQNPAGSLLQEIAGTGCTATSICLVGTAEGAGANGCGTVFQFVPPSGPFTVLHQFGCSTGTPVDGSAPVSAIIQPAANGTLYGTTYTGGASGYGTVYSLTPTGTYTLMHSFSGASDGRGPQATLLLDGNNLFGTTIYGGNAGGWSSLGQGSIFEISTVSPYPITNLYLFNGSVGSNPAGGLVLSHRVLYGDTVLGGTFNQGVFYGFKIP